MLEQAILDAKELKEAAIKNAQQSIIEKYSNEFEGEIEKLLEQAAAPADPAAAAPAADPMAGLGAAPAAAPMPGMTMPGSAPVDPEKAKSDSDNKSSMFDKLNYAFKDGEVIEDKIFPTGLVEVDLDSLSEFSFEDNKKTPEQMALQELKNLSLREQIEEEMNDDDDYDFDSDSFPYEDSEEEDDENEEESEEDEELDDEEFEDEDELEMDDEDFEDKDMESDSDELADLQDYNDEGSVDLEDEESDMDIDIEDEEFTDDEDMEDEDLYGTEDDVGFHVDYDTDEEDEESEEDYNPDADVEDFEDEESEEDVDEEEEDSEEDEEDEEYYYDDEEEDSEEDEEDSEEDDEEESEDEEEDLDEARDLTDKEKSKLDDIISRLERASKSIEKGSAKNMVDASARQLKDLLDSLKGSDKEELQEAIKLDWKRSGQRSPFTGMFKEEAEHDYMLEQVQAQIEALEQEVEELQESNKKLKSGLKESINLVENLTDKVKKYEQKLHESRLLNYKLLYTNKALSDSSLNGQQKNKIAESIDGAKTAEEVKLLYETLKSTMRDGTSRSTPKSLSEAVERRSSSLLLRGSRAEPKKQDDFAERMKRLAGL
jgi:hypothetical protein